MQYLRYLPFFQLLLLLQVLIRTNH